jgi:WD40 repeat protein
MNHMGGLIDWTLDRRLTNQIDDSMQVVNDENNKNDRETIQPSTAITRCPPHLCSPPSPSPHVSTVTVVLSNRSPYKVIKERSLCAYGILPLVNLPLGLFPSLIPPPLLTPPSSADGTCRLWGLWDASSATSLPDNTPLPIDAVVMPHSQHIGERYKDVTSVNWSPNGQHLATGCYDGVARVWTALGHLEMELNDHSGPVFSLKWSKDGQYLLSGSYDRRSIIWNPLTGKAVKTYLLHSAPVLDVDWSDSDLFATCSSDRTIFICKVSTTESTAIRALRGHEDEVNSVSWSPGGQYLASCSDDSTAKVLSLLLVLAVVTSVPFSSLF